MARLFFGMEVFCPWPEEFPAGKVLIERNRHLTLAFLGESNMPDLNSFPKPPFSVGCAGFFDKTLILAHVVAWHIHWFGEELSDFQKRICGWLGIENQVLHHVTLARKPCDEEGWKKAFRPLPCFVKNINLYESLGNSNYKILWHYPIAAPFEEIEHTADIAFIVRGNLYLHAQLALAFHFPPIIRYFDVREITDFDEIVSALNEILAALDSKIGSPFKAVSFHGTPSKSGEWEMIVDV